MSRGATMSILGLWQWDHNIFNLMPFPSFQDGVTLHEFTADDKQLLIDNLMSECAELKILYPNPTVMKNMIGLWSAKELPTWNRFYRAALIEYDPIENYHRTERATETLAHYDQHSGADTNQASGSDSINGGSTDTNSGTDTTTGKVTGYDSGILVDHDQTDLLHGHVITNIHNDGTTYGRKDTFTHGEKIDHGGTIKNDVEAFGNIGVTTSQQMLESELELAPKLNVFNYIIESFKNRFCIEVY